MMNPFQHIESRQYHIQLLPFFPLFVCFVNSKSTHFNIEKVYNAPSKFCHVLFCFMLYYLLSFCFSFQPDVTANTTDQLLKFLIALLASSLLMHSKIGAYTFQICCFFYPSGFVFGSYRFPKIPIG